MTIIVNHCWGGFRVPEEFCKAHNLSPYDDVDRDDPALIAFIKAHGGKLIEGSSKLVAIEIPDTCTDWDIKDYDGMETIIYVVDGKIHYA